MNRKNKVTAWISALFILGSSLAFAGNHPGAVTFSVGDGYYHFASKRHLDNVWMPNGALAYNFDDHWAVEGAVGVISSYINPPQVPVKKANHGFLYTVDGLYRFTPYGNLEPYVSAGVGILAIAPNGNNTEHQGNINAGVGAQYFFHPAIAFRAEARDLYTISRGNNDYMINLGMSFILGGCSNCKASEPLKTAYKGA